MYIDRRNGFYPSKERYLYCHRYKFYSSMSSSVRSPHTPLYNIDIYRDTTFSAPSLSVTKSVTKAYEALRNVTSVTNVTKVTKVDDYVREINPGSC